MRIVDFFNQQAILFVGFLAGASVGVLSLNKPQYRAARILGILAALLCGSIAVMWGITTTESFWPRVLGVGMVGFAVAVCLSEGIRFVRAQEKLEPPIADRVVSAAPPRGPTLEATNGSKIDATGATIPGDLPFQFGKADGSSLIDMPGITVTKTETGWQINTSPNTDREFPLPPDNLSKMSLSELKAAMHGFIDELLLFQHKFENDFFEPGHKYPPREKAEATIGKYSTIYRKDFSQRAFDLAAAALSRIGTISNLSRDLPPKFHPAAVRVRLVCTPIGAGGATGDGRSWSGLRSRSPVAVRFAA